MLIQVLGSAAGGGFPQWNCHCPNCGGVRSGAIKAKPRTQSSIALSQDGEDWLLVNASPDILAQIAKTPALHPGRSMRDSRIKAVALMDAQIDHVTGLLMLRERDTPLPIMATEEVFSDLGSGFPITSILAHYCGVERILLPLDAPAADIDGMPDLELQAIALESKPPPYSPHRSCPRPGDNIGLLITNRLNGARVFYAPGLANVSSRLLDMMSTCQMVLVDGTFWTNDEMSRQGLSQKSALDMGHLPQSGEDGMISRLGQLPSRVRKILIHINNTNPILREDSPERRQLEARGIEVAFDGMALELTGAAAP
jgi:pyrroloquinoline quinone biosynthesis protein B